MENQNEKKKNHMRLFIIIGCLAILLTMLGLGFFIYQAINKIQPRPYIVPDDIYRVENIRRCDLAGELWGQHQGFNDFRM